MRCSTRCCTSSPTACAFTIIISVVLCCQLSVVATLACSYRAVHASTLALFRASPETFVLPPALLRRSPGRTSTCGLYARRPQGAGGDSTVDYYHILGVERRASGQEIRARFLQLAKKLHPDVTKDPSDNARCETVRSRSIGTA